MCSMYNNHYHTIIRGSKNGWFTIVQIPWARRLTPIEFIRGRILIIIAEVVYCAWPNALSPLYGDQEDGILSFAGELRFPTKKVPYSSMVSAIPLSTKKTPRSFVADDEEGDTLSSSDEFLRPRKAPRLSTASSSNKSMCRSGHTLIQPR
jgi:hypothetical protein